MYFKLALKNVKKSFKDYSIYFLTLTFAVCIFYAFNSIGSQQALVEMDDSTARYMMLLKQMMGMVSLFVSVILGCLIMYGNHFLVKRRKKELGIYMTLGMAKNKIAQILFFETLIIGTLALSVGLILGVIGSQVLSLLVTKLFIVEMGQYAFSFSIGALGKTIAYFSVIFIVVMLFNTVVISKYQLIDLIQASRKNETWKMKKDGVSGVVMLGAFFAIGLAYYIIKVTGLNVESAAFWGAISLGALGTYGFFFGISGVLMNRFQKHQEVYLKGLNLFSVRQMHRNIHTNIFSMTLICLMLFLTITGLSTGLSFKKTMEQGMIETTPFDATAIIYEDREGEVRDVAKTLEAIGVSFEGTEAYAQYHEYRGDLSLGEMIGDPDDRWNKMTIYAIPLSEYNQMRALRKEDPVTLGEKELIVTSNQEKLIPELESWVESEAAATWYGETYQIYNEKVYEESLSSTGFSNNMITFIVPDEAVKGQKPSSSILNVNYGEGDAASSETKFREVFEAFRLGNYKGKEINYDTDGFVNGSTREMIYEDFQGTTTTILFIGIYLALVFLISSAAVLALQQLTEASDSIERYETLKKIGASKQMISKSILLQIGIYFMMPFGLAVIHSVVGISVVNDFLAMFNKPDIGGASVITLIMIAGIYGGYFYTTYMGYKNIINGKL